MMSDVDIEMHLTVIDQTITRDFPSFLETYLANAFYYFNTVVGLIFIHRKVDSDDAGETLNDGVSKYNKFLRSEFHIASRIR